MASNRRDGPKPPAEPAASRGASSHAKQKQKEPAKKGRPTRTPVYLGENAQGGTQGGPVRLGERRTKFILILNWFV